MNKLNLVTKAFLITLTVALLFTSVAYAESKTISNTTGNTWSTGSDIRSYTTTSYQMYRLLVHLRAWGAAPNPLKDQKTHAAFNTTSTNTVIMFPYYAVFPSQHASWIYDYASPVTFYTSSTGSQSTYSWWNCGNSSC